VLSVIVVIVTLLTIKKCTGTILHASLTPESMKELVCLSD